MVSVEKCPPASMVIQTYLTPSHVCLLLLITRKYFYFTRASCENCKYHGYDNSVCAGFSGFGRSASTHCSGDSWGKTRPTNGKESTRVYEAYCVYTAKCVKGKLHVCVSSRHPLPPVLRPPGVKKDTTCACKASFSLANDVLYATNYTNDVLYTRDHEATEATACCHE